MNKLYNLYSYYSQDIFRNKNGIDISFEFFPPKNLHGSDNFLQSINRLSVFNPTFISITCTSQQNDNFDITYNAIKKIPKKLNLNVAPHITYNNKTNRQIKNLALNYWNDGIRRIIALRGDEINTVHHSPVYASDLVLLLKSIADFKISVAAYPEVHPEAINSKVDLINLKNKIDCGADEIITQFFFDVEVFLKFRDRCYDFGINAEIIPGILSIVNFQQLKKFIKMTNVNVPQWIYNIYNELHHNDININKMIGLIICTNLIKRLCKEGVNKFHFYTLNHYDMIYALCSILKS